MIVILACIPYAPTRGNPIQHPQAFETIRNRRLNSFNVRKEISAEEWEEIISHHADCLSRVDVHVQPSEYRNAMTGFVAI